jgi:hypothetical protein
MLIGLEGFCTDFFLFYRLVSDRWQLVVDVECPVTACCCKECVYMLVLSDLARSGIGQCVLVCFWSIDAESSVFWNR